jgi:hypothetical protein
MAFFDIQPSAPKDVGVLAMVGADVREERPEYEELRARTR